MSDKGKKFKKPKYVTEQEAEEQKRIQAALSGLNAIAYPSKKGNVMIAQSSGSAYQQVPGATPNLPVGDPPPVFPGGDLGDPPRHPRLPPSSDPSQPSQPAPIDPTVPSGGRVPNPPGRIDPSTVPGRVDPTTVPGRIPKTSQKPKGSKPKKKSPHAQATKASIRARTKKKTSLG